MSKPRIPTEFRYWEQLETPYAKALRQLLRAVFGVEPRLPDEAVRKYAEAYYDADPVAEAFIDEVYLTQGQVCLLYTSPSPRDRTRSRMPSSA